VQVEVQSIVNTICRSHGDPVFWKISRPLRQLQLAKVFFFAAD
jgi:hypothetical protein